MLDRGTREGWGGRGGRDGTRLVVKGGVDVDEEAQAAVVQGELVGEGSRGHGVVVGALEALEALVVQRATSEGASLCRRRLVLELALRALPLLEPDHGDQLLARP